MKYGYPDRALQTIEEIVKEGQGDAELLALKAQCLFATQDTGKAVDWSYKVIGYDPRANTFDAAKGLAPDQPRVYAMVAQYLLGSGQKDLAKRVIDQLIVANPESRDAYVFQFQILAMLDKQEEARAAIEKAFAIDPKDASVLQAKGKSPSPTTSRRWRRPISPKTPKSRSNAQGRREVPRRGGWILHPRPAEFSRPIGFYKQVAQIELYRQHLDEAMKIIEDG